MRIVFMGTPDLAASCFARLMASQHEIVGAFCQPDKPRGRNPRPAPPPVKERALDCGIPVCQPRRLGPRSRALLAEMAPDIIVVAAYGKLLPPSVLTLPRLGCINVHASLLPAWRGAAPIQWAIASGDPVTGVTLMQMDEGLDTGDILAQRETPIGPEDTAATLHDRLADIGGALLLECLPALEAGQLAARPQDDAQATWAPMLSKEDSLLDWSWPRDRIANRIRGFHPWPGTQTTFRGRQLKVHPFAHDAGADRAAAPGTITRIRREGLVVACGDGQLLLTSVQLQGKRRLPAHDFATGARIEPGETLGGPSQIVNRKS